MRAALLEEHAGTLRLATSAVAGTWWLHVRPWPSDDAFVHLVAATVPLVAAGAMWTYRVLAFTTPYLVSWLILSVTYVFSRPARRGPTVSALPPYAPPATRRDSVRRAG